MVEVFYYDTFQKTINPEPEGGPLVRHSAFAELAAENERLKQEAAEWEVIAREKSEEALTHRREAEAMMSALASTGAVKVKAARAALRELAATPMNLSLEDWDRISNAILSALDTHPRATNTVDAHETANVSDKPEGQQEPVVVIARRIADQVWLDTFEKRELVKLITDAFTRPSEQAVTEAMQVRIAEAVYHIGFIKAMNGTTDEIRKIADKAVAALKAAMEAVG